MSYEPGTPKRVSDNPAMVISSGDPHRMHTSSAAASDGNWTDWNTSGFGPSFTLSAIWRNLSSFRGLFTCARSTGSRRVEAAIEFRRSSECLLPHRSGQLAFVDIDLAS